MTVEGNDPEIFLSRCLKKGLHIKNIVYETDTHTITINGINGSDISLSLYTDDGNEVGNLQYESHENGDITIDNPNSDGFILYIEYQGMTYVANYSLQ